MERHRARLQAWPSIRLDTHTLPGGSWQCKPSQVESCSCEGNCLVASVIPRNWWVRVQMGRQSMHCSAQHGVLGTMAAGWHSLACSGAPCIAGLLQQRPP
jgi:hypothetical protein